MSIVDYDAMLDTIYSMQGVAATFVSRDGIAADLVVMDKRSGVELPGGPMLTQALQPAVMVRGSELVSMCLEANRLRGGRLTVAETCWSIESVRPKPKPNGGGEFYLFLQERNDG